MPDPVKRDQSKYRDPDGHLRYSADHSLVFPGKTGVRDYRAPIFTPGDSVTVTSVDEYAWQGRDPHPEPEREDQTGTVVGVVMSEWIDDPDASYLAHFYAVRFEDNAVRVMVEYELT